MNLHRLTTSLMAFLALFCCAALAVPAQAQTARAIMIERQPLQAFASTCTATSGETGQPCYIVAFRAVGASVDGTIRQVCLDAAGVYCAPYAATVNRVVTKTSISANTNTTVCPVITAPVYPAAVEIYFTTAAVGVGINGQTLTQATWGSTTTTPDIVIGTAGTLYTFPVAPTNIITAYGAAGGISCIQTLRQ